jgi:hypothetical protein
VGWSLYISLGTGLVALVLWVLDRDVWALLPLAVGVPAFVVNRIVDIFIPFREKKEAAEGYATFVRGFGPMRLEHVDPRTGRLVSFAGEELGRGERRERIRMIRAQCYSSIEEGEPPSGAEPREIPAPDPTRRAAVGSFT